MAITEDLIEIEEVMWEAMYLALALGDYKRVGPQIWPYRQDL